MRLAIPRLYAIIDPAQTGGRSIEEICESLLAAGVRLIQYRDKLSSTRSVFEAATRLVALAKQAGGRLILNDRADIALASGAGGVHVGQDDLAPDLARQVIGRDLWLGVSTHNPGQLHDADATTADYVAIGPVFQTSSKANPDPVVGLEGIRIARKATAKPLVAIGGITAGNARDVIEAGADSVAVIRDLIAGPNVLEQARAFLKAVS